MGDSVGALMNSRVAHAWLNSAGPGKRARRADIDCRRYGAWQALTQNHAAPAPQPLPWSKGRVGFVWMGDHQAPTATGPSKACVLGASNDTRLTLGSSDTGPQGMAYKRLRHPRCKGAARRLVAALSMALAIRVAKARSVAALAHSQAHTRGSVSAAPAVGARAARRCHRCLCPGFDET